MPQKKLVLWTVAILVLLSAIVTYYSHTTLPSAIALNTDGQPTIGYPKATVRIVVFEEPKCVNCKFYNNTIFPKIKEEFIDTNKVLYTVIPVSFLPNSMPAASSLLCVYHQDYGYPNDELFFKYLDYMYDHQPPEHQDWATIDTLVDMAKKASPAINLTRLRNCGEREGSRILIEKNTHYGNQIMNGSVSTPTIYVNGIEVKEITFKEIKKLVKTLLQQKGVH